jgi:hypothetical protein
MSSDKFSNVSGYTTHSELPADIGTELNDYHPAVKSRNTNSSMFKLKLEKSVGGDYYAMKPVEGTGWNGTQREVFGGLKLKGSGSIPINCIEDEPNRSIKDYILVKFKISYIEINLNVIYQAELKWKKPTNKSFVAYSKWFWIPD